MKFRYSIENFRALAILFVMLSHVGSYRQFGTVGQFVYFLVGDATTLFVFISGFLFAYLEQNRFDYPAYLQRKAKFVLSPYLLLSVPAILAGLYFSRPELMGLSWPAYAAWSLVVGGSVIVPMWFVPMIFVFFLLSPLFHMLGKSKFLYPAAVAGLAVALFSFRPVQNLNPFLETVHFFGFYILGIAFAVASPKLTSLSKQETLVIATVGIAVFLVSAYFYDESAPRPIGFWENFGSLNVMQLGKLGFLVAVFVLFEQFFNQRNKAFAYIAEISFGLFFLHGFYLVFFAKAVQYVDIDSQLVYLLAELAMGLIAPTLTIIVLKKILKGKSRYVIGC